MTQEYDAMPRIIPIRDLRNTSSISEMVQNNRIDQAIFEAGSGIGNGDKPIL